MPIKRAAYKRVRADKKKRLKNLGALSEIKTLARKLNDYVSNNKQDEARKLLREISSKLYKAVSKKILHKNTASRKLSRLARRVEIAFKERKK